MVKHETADRSVRVAVPMLALVLTLFGVGEGCSRSEESVSDAKQSQASGQATMRLDTDSTHGTAEAQAPSVAKLAADVQFGTPEVRDKALARLAGIDSVESSEVLGKFMMTEITKEAYPPDLVRLVLKELRKTPHTEYSPALSEALSNLVGVFNPPGREPWAREESYPPYSSWDFPSEAEIVELIIRMGDHPAVPTQAEDDSLLSIGERFRPRIKRGDPVDGLIISLATGSYRVGSPAGRYVGVRGISDGDNRCYFTQTIIEAIPRLCDRKRADKLILGIVSGYYSYLDDHPMDAAVYYLRDHPVEGGREILEGILEDSKTIERMVVPTRTSPFDFLVSRKGHWVTAAAYGYSYPKTEAGEQRLRELQTSTLDAMIPILWALLEYGSPLAREYAVMLNGTAPADNEDLALILAAVGDMSRRSKVHEVLRSPKVSRRKLAAECMVRGGNLDAKDLALLSYVADNDPDPEVRAAAARGAR